MEALAATPMSSAESRERWFFVLMAVLIALTVAGGFGIFYKAGLSSFASPWWVHVHAVTFLTWIGLYGVQTLLVARNNTSRHRTLGRFGAVWSAWMVIVALVLTPVNLATHRAPPFFTPPYFLALDWSNIVIFGVLVYAAVRNRARTDWHRRLMFCATVCVIAPAVGRLILLSGNTMTAPVLVAMLMPYLLLAMAFDLVNRGRVHAAYLWGGGALLLLAVLPDLISRIPAFAGLATSLVA